MFKRNPVILSCAQINDKESPFSNSIEMMKEVSSLAVNKLLHLGFKNQEINGIMTTKSLSFYNKNQSKS